VGGVREPAKKQDRAAAVVSNGKYERMIGPKNGGLLRFRYSHGHRPDDDARRRGCLGSLFIHVDERFVQNGGNLKSPSPVNSGEIGRSGTNGRRHSHRL
jgi:hypothetical protein